MIQKYECTQCGSTDFSDEDTRDRVRCNYCGSLYQIQRPKASIIINKGANVTFGKNANVEIFGDMEIEQGATVDIQGKIKLIKKGKKVEEFKLNIVKKSKDQ